MIERLRRATWNWLPAFLEIAETGSVVRASKRLALTPAAVSRTLRLLEAEVGEPLFNRVGRALALNTTGAALRGAVRAAQRAVDVGLAEALGAAFGGPLRVASLGVLTDHFVVPAVIDLLRAHGDLQPEHLNLGTVEANALLSRGQLDVAFYYEDVTVQGVLVRRIGHTPAAVYCGRAHPLFGQRRASRDHVLAHPFSVPQIGDTGRVMDGWPPEIPRRIGMRITVLRSNLQVALSGALLTVLPEVTAAPHVAGGELRRLGAVELPPIEVFAARHESATERGAVLALIRDVEARLRAPAGGRRLRR
jgi:DNA-binding transcriptional LysR family regulator